MASLASGGNNNNNNNNNNNGKVEKNEKNQHQGSDKKKKNKNKKGGGRPPVKFVEGMSYDKQTCRMLRNELIKRGLRRTGIKEDLIKRLKDDDNNPNNEDMQVEEAEQVEAPIEAVGGIQRQESMQLPDLNDLDLMCGITQDLFVDPVVTCDGHTYSRTSIERWFSLGHDTSPNTGLALDTLRLYPSIFVKNRVEKYKNECGLKIIELLERNEIDRVRKMIKNDLANLEARREGDRKTPLLVAADMNLYEIVELLISNGADINATDADGIGMGNLIPWYINKWKTEFDGKTEVDLSGKNLTNVDALAIGELLKTNNTLKELYLENNNITDVQSIGDALKTNNTLEILSLQSNNITNVQSIGEGLKTNNTLRSLELQYNNITDVQSIGEGLKTNNTLTELYLYNNNITDVQSIGEGLKTNNTLMWLSLGNNNITDDGGIQSIIDVLKTNNTLHTLSLYNNQLSGNMKSQLNAILQYKKDGSNGYQQVKGMKIYT